MPNDMVMIHADILKVTKKFVTVRCGESEETLKLWEVEADEPLEAGQVDMALRIPKAEADALGLPVAEEMESVPESSLEEPEEADSNTNTEPTDLCPDETPEDEEDDPRPSRGPGSTWLRKDICEKSFPLSDDEKLELGDTMAKAQEKIDALEDELQSIRKSFKARIEEQQEILSKAAKEYRDGKTEPQEVECDVFQDWSTDELVYVTADESAEEIMRRPMTDDEKRPTLTPRRMARGIPLPWAKTRATRTPPRRRLRLGGTPALIARTWPMARTAPRPRSAPRASSPAAEPWIIGSRGANVAPATTAGRRSTCRPATPACATLKSVIGAMTTTGYGPGPDRWTPTPLTCRLRCPMSPRRGPPCNERLRRSKPSRVARQTQVQELRPHLFILQG